MALLIERCKGVKHFDEKIFSAPSRIRDIKNRIGRQNVAQLNEELRWGSELLVCY